MWRSECAGRRTSGGGGGGQLQLEGSARRLVWRRASGHSNRRRGRVQQVSSLTAVSIRAAAAVALSAHSRLVALQRRAAGCRLSAKVAWGGDWLGWAGLGEAGQPAGEKESRTSKARPHTHAHTVIGKPNKRKKEQQHGNTGTAQHQHKRQKANNSTTAPQHSDISNQAH